MGKTKIEWCDYTFNPWAGCQWISPACDHCYAAAFSRRYCWNCFGENPRRMFSDKHWGEPLKWQKKAARDGTRPSVFCASLADVFEDRAELAAVRSRLWKLIGMTPGLQWLILTKRPENIIHMIPVSWLENQVPANVAIGVTAENQDMFEERVNMLINSPARRNFVSMEPLLEFVDISEWLDAIDWVIAGGESGPHARPMNPSWIRDLREQCIDVAVPFFFKQWGEWVSVSGVEGVDGPGRLYRFQDGETVRRIGKAKAGRSLDGDEWNDCPQWLSASGSLAGGEVENGST